jgi:hypothetical protein
MSPRLKKLIGTLGIFVWLAIYALLMMRLAVAVLPGAHPLVQLLFYAVAGLAWIVPVGLALPWMHRPARPRAPSPERDRAPL